MERRLHSGSVWTKIIINGKSSGFPLPGIIFEQSTAEDALTFKLDPCLTGASSPNGTACTRIMSVGSCRSRPRCDNVHDACFSSLHETSGEVHRVSLFIRLAALSSVFTRRGCALSGMGAYGPETEWRLWRE